MVRKAFTLPTELPRGESNLHVSPLAPGTYVVAVSGGVDSMVLLDLLSRAPGLELIVAHFDHGIRSDSEADCRLVSEAAQQYGLSFIYEHGRLGAKTSEATARTARYAFLQRVQEAHGARAIITAHHQDDVLETAVLNILRGTGRKGLAALRSTETLVRPLLGVTKQEIEAYAVEHRIVWHEDSTNASDAYLRNYIRHHIIPRLGEQGRTQLLAHIQNVEQLNPAIDALLLHDLQRQHAADELQRNWFIMLPYTVSCEVMAAWLRSYNVRQFDKKRIGELVVFAKVAAAGKQTDITDKTKLRVGKATLAIVSG